MDLLRSPGGFCPVTYRTQLSSFLEIIQVWIHMNHNSQIRYGKPISQSLRESNRQSKLLVTAKITRAKLDDFTLGVEFDDFLQNLATRLPRDIELV